MWPVNWDELPGTVEIVRRIAVFAHYDRDGIIADHVLYYLRGLRQVAERILFCSDSDLPPDELSRLDGLAEPVWTGRHGGYDFGSWQRGLSVLAKEGTGSVDELILANDSCYGPIFPFAPMFDAMADDACDFWGQTATDAARRGWPKHVNSYFIVFRKPVLDNDRFWRFWQEVEPKGRKEDVVREYEIGLSQTLLDAGYRVGTYAGYFDRNVSVREPFARGILFEKKCPLLKVSIFRDNIGKVSRLDDLLADLSDHYPVDMIKAHVERMTGTSRPPHFEDAYPLTEFRTDILDHRFLHLQGKYTRGRKWWRFRIKLFGLSIFLLPIPVHRHRWRGAGRNKGQTLANR